MRTILTLLLFVPLISFSQISSFVDSRDGKEYKSVKIGEQVWVAENLAFKADSGNYWAYNNDTNNISIYGFLYDWETANEVCPSGWHLPSRNEWSELFYYLGREDALEKLKSTSNWKVSGNGNNESGFNAIAGGEFYKGDYQYIDSIGSWWTSSSHGEVNTSYWTFNINYRLPGQSPYHIMNGIKINGSHSIAGLSVRCIED